MADPHIPAEALLAARYERSRKPLELPTKWDEELAHYLGWLVGDGCIDARDNVAVTVYGSEEEQESSSRATMPCSPRSLASRASRAVQANGTLQLRVTRRAFGEFLRALGVSGGRAPAKRCRMRSSRRRRRL